MCGRFALTLKPEEVEAFFALLALDDFPPRYNIAPTQPILMVMAGEGGGAPGSNLPDRRALLVRWGLIPAWVKEPKSFPLLFNARSDTALEKNTYKTAMRHRRALVPASGFYEWRREGRNKAQAYWVRPKDGGLVGFAGLMETWYEPGGSEVDTGAILTTDANVDIAHIHERMPAAPASRATWPTCCGLPIRASSRRFPFPTRSTRWPTRGRRYRSPSTSASRSPRRSRLTFS
jgi:putative SOS response-associated peptidase YedK